MRIVLIGPPGVGKGTQAVLLRERTGATHLATGDIFREQISSGTELGLEAKKFIDQGQLVPDEITIKMVRSCLVQTVPDLGFILDGFPRTVGQAVALDAMLADLDRPLELAISLRVDDDIVVTRLSGRLTCPVDGTPYHMTFNPPDRPGYCDECGSELIRRPDDNPETIRGRLGVFHTQTAPVIDYYRNQGKLAEIEGDQDTETVYAAIQAALCR